MFDDLIVEITVVIRTPYYILLIKNNGLYTPGFDSCLGITMLVIIIKMTDRCGKTSRFSTNVLDMIVLKCLDMKLLRWKCAASG